MIEEKQIFTRKEIEIDLKNVYKLNILISVELLFCFGLTGYITWIYIGIPNLKEESTFSIVFTWVLYIIAFSIILAVFSVLIYNIYIFFKHPKYEIVSDVYQCYYRKRQFITYTPHFSFKLYGDYPVDLEIVKYKWLKDTVITGETILNTISQGEEYYLIIVNNKIAYIYSKRVFKFKETI